MHPLRSVCQALLFSIRVSFPLVYTLNLSLFFYAKYYAFIYLLIIYIYIFSYYIVNVLYTMYYIVYSLYVINILYVYLYYSYQPVFN